MSNQLDTNLNQSPYFNDYDSSKQYYYDLFKPSTAVQTRELNVLQDMLYNQISGIGNNLYISGTIIQGCNITTNRNLNYVKILDTYANGAALNINNLVGYNVVSNTGLSAVVYYAQPGYVATSPNLNTLYVGYLNSAVNTTTNTVIKTFQNDEVLNIVNASNTVVSQITVANTISSGSSNTTGYGYSLSVDDGLIFQKGRVLNVIGQTLIVSPYSNAPNNISVGFSSVESIITAYQDETLFDNSQGTNKNAPGADRLQIVPTLITITSTDAGTLGNNFFSIVDFINGSPSYINQDTQYNVIGKQIASLSSDTNGSFIINPFNIRLKQIYFANNTLDTGNMRLEIDSGSAYINGNKINLVGQLLSVMKKGVDYNQSSQQILTAQMGNYLQVQEVAGIFDPTIIQTVQLRSSPSYAVSNGLAKGITPNNLPPAGSQIGTATLVGFQYISGTESTPNGQFYAYLSNISINSGSFANVRSIYANNGGVIGIADIIQQNNTTILQNPAFAPRVYSFNQNAIKTLKTASNTIDTQFEYRAKTSVSFANTGNATITVSSYTGGNNVLPYGTGNLNSLQMTSDIIVVCETNVATGNISGSFSATSTGNVVTGFSSNLNNISYLGVGSFITLANTTSSETKQISTITNSTSLTTTIPFSTTWSTVNAYVTYLAGDPIPLSAANASVNVTNATSMVISLPVSETSSFNATVFYNVLRTAAAPATKNYQTTIYAKIDCSNNAGNTVGPWCLGLPDVVSISNVWVGTTYSNTNTSATSKFRLDGGQRDASYNLAYLQSNGITLSTSNKILVELQCFIPNYSTSQGYFSVDSYLVDDTGQTANSIYTYQIPTYNCIALQQLINLRSAIDFRFYAQNTIPYIGNTALAIANVAIINPNSTFTYTSSNYYAPDPNSLIETSLQYYMGRYDTVGISNNGNIIIKSGNPSENPIPPGAVSAGMTLGTVYIPPYPSLTSDIIVNSINPFTPTVSVNYNSNKRYTMADIGNLDSRLQQVEYYTSLSVLEQSAQNLLLTNQAGSNRFQTGILADPMQDFSIANTNDPSFNIAIDSENSVARPTYNQSLTDLVFNSVANDNVVLSNNGRLITLNYTQAANAFISQPFASQERNCSQETLYVWQGTVTLSPEGDYFPDVTTNPAVVVNLNEYSNWVSLANAWGTQWGNWNEVAASNNNQQINYANGLTTNITSTTQTSTEVGTKISVTTSNTSQSFGTYLTSVVLQPYCRSLLILFNANGLKPSTQFWTYFNDTNVTNNCVQISSANLSNFSVVSNTSLMSDSNGNLYGLFLIPASTFNSGTINFQLMDIPNLTTQNNIITSIASTQYFGTNLAYTQNALDLNTTQAQLSYTTVSNTITTTNTLTINTQSIINNIYNNQYNISNKTTNYYTDQNYYTNNSYYTINQITNAIDSSSLGGNPSNIQNQGNSRTGQGSGGASGSDPIAQSFYVSDSIIPNAVEGVYATSLDVFFAAKDPNLGITIQLQPVENGSIIDQVVPFSQIHLTPSQINTSTDSSKATNIVFPAPILLYKDTSYAFVLIPDGSNPNYDVWTATIGGKDIISKSSIFSFNTTGVMFLSSQGTTWTPYQNENIKFNLYIANFTQNQGTASFINANYDYMTVNNRVGNFQLGETILFGNYDIANNAGIVNASSTLVKNANTTGLNSATRISVISATNQNSFSSIVNTVINSTSFTLNANVPFTDSNAMIMHDIYNMYGKLQYSNSNYLVVNNPSVNTTNYLMANTNYFVIGANSGAYTNSSMLADIPYDTLMGKFSESVPATGLLNYSMVGTSNSTTGYVQDTNLIPLTYGRSINFLDTERVVMSISNEAHYLSGKKSLTVNVQFLEISTQISPVLDTVKTGAVTVYNIVNNESGNTIFLSEINNAGNAINKYISTTVTLASGLEAEDLLVYIGAYYPPGTEIYVYSKIQNQYDSDNFTNKSWTPMFTNNTVRSSLTNVGDYNEYQFTFPTVNTTPSTAYLDSSNSYCVAYQTSNGTTFETFNTFAIKIVLLSNTSQIVPQITDMRAIATTIAS